MVIVVAAHPGLPSFLRHLNTTSIDEISWVKQAMGVNMSSLPILTRVRERVGKGNRWVYGQMFKVLSDTWLGLSVT